MQEGKVVIWEGFTNSWEMKRSKMQERRGKIWQKNTEFQRIARRDKKAFLNDQCKEIGGKYIYIIRKSRDLFEKIGDIKGIYREMMGMIKDRNNKVLIEAEEIEKWQGYTEALNKKDLNDLDNHDS